MPAVSANGNRPPTVEIGRGTMIRFRDVSTRAKTTAAFGILLAAAIAMIVMVATQIHAIRRAVELNQQSAEIIRLSHVAEKGLIRVNSQMRGVLLTGRFEYLDTYVEGRRQFTSSVGTLYGLVDLARQRAMIRRIVAENREWHRNYGDRLIAMARAPGGRAAATRILMTAGPRSRVTYLTRMVTALRDSEEQRIVQRERELHGSIAQSFTVLGVGGVCLLAIATLMGWMLTVLIATPLARLTGVVDRLALHDFDATVPDDQRDRGDEVGRIARSLEIFRVAGVRNQRLEAEAKQLTEARARDAEDAAHRIRQDAERDRDTIRIIGEGLASIARGDLTFRLRDGLSPEAAILKNDYDAALAQLGALLRRVRTTVAAVDRDANGIAVASGRLADRTVQQAAAIGVVGDRLTQVHQLIGRNTTGAKRVEEVVQSTRRTAEHSRQTVTAAVHAMARIDESSEQIGMIAGLVRSIAQQTQLLALNAQMEAARAGAAGSGFAVVAKEVSQLATRLRQASEEIGESLAQARSCAIEGVDLVGAASVKLGEILRDVGEMSTLVADMAAAAERQAHDVRDVDAQMRDIAIVTEENATTAGDATAICATFLGGASELARSMAEFRIPAGRAIEHRVPHAEAA